MPISLHRAALAPCLQTLDALAIILAKAAADATARRIDPTILIQARLYPDMLPLVRQIQIAADGAKTGAARLAGTAYPSFPDAETTFDQLQTRIADTTAFLRSLDPVAIDAAPDRRIEFVVNKRPMAMIAPDYVTGWMLPNFFFHATTAFNILRHNGLPIGKRDFLGEVPLV